MPPVRKSKRHSAESDNTDHSDKENSTKPVSRRTRAYWTAKNDATLIQFLIEECRSGNMTSNASFKEDTWNAAAKKVNESDPKPKGSGPKTSANCKSRYNTLKRDAQVFNELKNKSGFGVDPETGVLSAPDEVWAPILKKHPKWVKWKTTPFPLHEEIMSLIEGNVATGETAFRIGQEEDMPLDEPQDDLDDGAQVDNIFGTTEEELDDEEQDYVAASMAPAEPKIPAHSISRTASIGSSTSLSASTSASSARPHTVTKDKKRRQQDDSRLVSEGLHALSAAFREGDQAMLATQQDATERLVQTIEEDGEMSDNELMDVYEYLNDQKNDKLARMLLAMNRTRRTAFIRRKVAQSSLSFNDSERNNSWGTQTQSNGSDDLVNLLDL